MRRDFSGRKKKTKSLSVTTRNALFWYGLKFEDEWWKKMKEKNWNENVDEPGFLMKTSQMLGPRPSLWAIPSTWYADVAVPNKNPLGKVSLLNPPVSKRTVWGSAAASAPAINKVIKKHNGVRDTIVGWCSHTTHNTVRVSELLLCFCFCEEKR